MKLSTVSIGILVVGGILWGFNLLGVSKDKEYFLLHQDEIGPYIKAHQCSDQKPRTDECQAAFDAQNTLRWRKEEADKKAGIKKNDRKHPCSEIMKMSNWC